MEKKTYDKNKIKGIVELYTAIQSEGSRAGMPTIIVRTTGCTHRCWFGDGGWCDSFYTSIEPEKAKYSFNDVVELYHKNPGIKEMMITGGSPSMWPELVNELTRFASTRDIIVTMETEGSHFVETEHPIDLVSISPKFSNTIPQIGVLTPGGKPTTERFIKQHNKFRLNIDAIRKSIEYHKDYHMKIVVNPKEQPKIWYEISDFLILLKIPKNKVWIMPPGDTREELIRVYPMVMDFCTENNFNFTGREHIIAYDTQRYV